MAAQHTIGIDGHVTAQHAISSMIRVVVDADRLVDVGRFVDTDWVIGVWQLGNQWPRGNTRLEDQRLGNQQLKNL